MLESYDAHELRGGITEAEHLASKAEFAPLEPGDEAQYELVGRVRIESHDCANHRECGLSARHRYRVTFLSGPATYTRPLPGGRLRFVWLVRKPGADYKPRDLSQLREHVLEDHPRLDACKSVTVLSREHAEQHHRFGSTSHYHAGPNTGAGERPRGWYTGQDATPHPPRRNI